jgi:hypothetical protein
MILVTFETLWSLIISRFVGNTTNSKFRGPTANHFLMIIKTCH